MTRVALWFTTLGLGGGVVGSVGSEAFAPGTGWLLRSELLLTASAVAAYVGFLLLAAGVASAAIALVARVVR